MPALTGEYINKLIKEQSNNAVKISVQELIDIYQDNWSHLIEQELRDQFTQKTYDKIKWLVTQELNLLKRWVNDTSMIYKKPAVRKAVRPVKEEGAEPAEDPQYAEMEQESNIDAIMPMVNKYTNLTNHVLLKPVWRGGKMEYDIILFNNGEVFSHPDDWKKIIAVKYYAGLSLPVDYIYPGEGDVTKVGVNKGAKRDQFGQLWSEYKRAFLYTLEDVTLGHLEDGVWVEETAEKGFIYTIEQKGKEEKIIDTQENPYRDEKGNVVLPFVLFSKEEAVDKLLNFTSGNDLRDANMNLAVNLTHLNSLLKFQSYKQAYIITDNKTRIPKEMMLDPMMMLLIKSAEGKGQVGVLDLQADIKATWETIKERITTVLAQQGISPQNYELSGTPQSGFALKINNQGKMEAREAQLPHYRKKEKELFELSRVVYNYHNPNEQIPMDMEFQFDPAEIKFPMTQEETQNEFTFRKQYNAATAIDLIRSINPDLTEEQAREVYIKNKEFNQAETPTVTMAPPEQPGGE